MRFLTRHHAVGLSFSAWALVAAAFPVSAATLSFGAANLTVGVNRQFQADLLLDTSSREHLNAFEGTIRYPRVLLALNEIRDGNSFVTFWIERPHETQPGEIVFSGITPGGYTGVHGLLFSMVFRSTKEGGGKIDIQNGQALQNDGRGTRSDLKFVPLSVRISGHASVPQTPVPDIRDTDPPEPFTPLVSRDPGLFEGSWFVVFATQDKKSGVDHYELQENQNGTPDIAKWKTATSPFVLHDQTLRSFILIKAVDKAGNERIAVVPPSKPVVWYANYPVWIIIGLILTAMIFWYLDKHLWKKIFDWSRRKNP